MTSWQVYRKSIFILLVFLIALGGAACVELDVTATTRTPTRKTCPRPWWIPKITRT